VPRNQTGWMEGLGLPRHALSPTLSQTPPHVKSLFPEPQRVVVRQLAVDYEC
jgi:hypothetical protein